MRSMSILGLTGALLLSPLTMVAQEAPASLATLHLADGTSVALLEWKLSYEFVIWRKKDRISNAKSETRDTSILLLGKKNYEVAGETLTLTHREEGDSFRVASMSLRQAGEVKIEPPEKDAIAPNLEKDYLYQPRSLDISGKTLSGIGRSFCIVSFSALVDCGRTETTRVVGIDFN